MNFFKRQDKTLILFVLLLAVILRIYNLESYGIWIDEKASVLNSNAQCLNCPLTLSKDYFTQQDFQKQFSWKNFIKSNNIDNGGNNIAYNFLLHYWQKPLGSKDFPVRLFSVLWGVLTVVLGYFISLLLFNNKKTALFTGFLFCIHPLLIHYSQHARGYAMATFFSLAASTLFIFILKSDKVKLIHYTLYLICMFIALLSHYLSIYIFIIQGLYALYAYFTTSTSIATKKKKYMYVIFSLIAGGILLFWWVYFYAYEGLKYMQLRNDHYASLSKQIASGENKTDNFALPATLVNILKGWGQVVLQLFGNSLQNTGLRIREAAPLLIFSLVLLTLNIRTILKDLPLKNFVLLLGFIFSAPLFATVLAMKSGHIISFQPLYAIFSAPYAMVLIAHTINTNWINSKNKTVSLTIGTAFTAMLIIMLYSLSGTYFDKGFAVKREKNPYVKIASHIQENYKEGDVIIYSNWQDAQLTNLYFSSKPLIKQKVDTLSFPDKIVKKDMLNGENITIMDFKNKNIRY